MGRRRNETGWVYIRVSKDKYRLIEAIADTIKELAEICEAPPNSIASMISKGEGCYEKIYIGDIE